MFPRLGAGDFDLAACRHFSSPHPFPLSNAFFVRDLEGIGEGSSGGFAFRFEVRKLPILRKSIAIGN
jgi:hypothetical protein